MGKVVFITGASSGIGLAAAMALHAKGYIVYGGARSMLSVDQPFNKLSLDVTDTAAVNEAVDRIIKTHGRIDVLINSAGYNLAGPFELLEEEEIKRQMDVNFFGTLRTIKAVCPFMKTMGGGRIINISSIAGLMGLPYQSIYSASKFAMEGLSESLSMELAAFNIQVTVLSPGDIKTNITANRKLLRHSLPGTSYEHSFESALKKIESDEQKGLKVEAIANLIVKIIDAKQPSFRYIPALFLQRFSVLLKRLLPYRVFGRMLSGYYR